MPLVYITCQRGIMLWNPCAFLQIRMRVTSGGFNFHCQLNIRICHEFSREKKVLTHTPAANPGLFSRNLTPIRTIATVFVSFVEPTAGLRKKKKIKSSDPRIAYNHVNKGFRWTEYIYTTNLPILTPELSSTMKTATVEKEWGPPS